MTIRKIFATFLSMMLFLEPARACITLPTKISHGQSTFKDVDLRIGDGIFGASLMTDESQMFYSRQHKKWCVLPNEKMTEGVRCLSEQSGNVANVIELQDKAKNKKGVIQFHGATAIIWSVNEKGQIDKTKPYLRISDSSELLEKPSSDVTCRAIDCPRIHYSYRGKLRVDALGGNGVLKEVGVLEFSSGAEGTYTYSPLFDTLKAKEPRPAKMHYVNTSRSINLDDKPKDTVDLDNKAINVNGCKTTAGKYSQGTYASQPSPDGRR